MYSSFGRQIFNASDSNQIGMCISELTEKLRERRVADSEFDAGFEQIIYTKLHTSQKSLVQYILKKVSLFEGQPTLGDSDDLTIEHLVPQSSRKDGISESVIGQLGNLILVDHKTNELLSTNDFKTKKRILLDRGYKLPEVISEAKELNESMVLSNTHRISQIARDTIWRV